MREFSVIPVWKMIDKRLYNSAKREYTAYINLPLKQGSLFKNRLFKNRPSVIIVPALGLISHVEEEYNAIKHLVKNPLNILALRTQGLMNYTLNLKEVGPILVLLGDSPFGLNQGYNERPESYRLSKEEISRIYRLSQDEAFISMAAKKLASTLGAESKGDLEKRIEKSLRSNLPGIKRRRNELTKKAITFFKKNQVEYTTEGMERYIQQVLSNLMPSANQRALYK